MQAVVVAAPQPHQLLEVPPQGVGAAAEKKEEKKEESEEEEDDVRPPFPAGHIA